jgi:hypothetical protein
MNGFSETDIYGYSMSGDDGQMIYEDPLAIRRTLILETSGRIDQIVSECKRASEGIAELIKIPQHNDQQAAMVADLYCRVADHEKTLIKASYMAFGADPVDSQTGDGITETKALRLLLDFVRWCQEKKQPAVI